MKDLAFLLASGALLGCGILLIIVRRSSKQLPWIIGAFCGSGTAALLAAPVYEAMDQAFGGGNHASLIHRALLAATLLAMNISIWLAVASNDHSKRMIRQAVGVAFGTYACQVVLFCLAPVEMSASGLRQYEHDPVIASYSALMLGHLAFVALSAAHVAWKYSNTVKSPLRKTSLELIGVGSIFSVEVVAVHVISLACKLWDVSTEVADALDGALTACAAALFAASLCVTTVPRGWSTAVADAKARKRLWQISPVWTKLRPEIHALAIWPHIGRLAEPVGRKPDERLRRRITEIRDISELNSAIFAKLSEAQLATLQRIEAEINA